jgi:hypothetical protein
MNGSRAINTWAVPEVRSIPIKAGLTDGWEEDSCIGVIGMQARIKAENKRGVYYKVLLRRRRWRWAERHHKGPGIERTWGSRVYRIF